MSFSHGSKAKVLSNGYVLSLFLREFQVSYVVDSAETSTFGNTHKTYTPGLLDSTLSMGGIFDGAANAVDQAFSEMLSSVSDDIFTYMPQGDILGSVAKGFVAVTTNYSVTSSVSDVSAVSLQAQNNVGEESGVVIHPQAAEGSPGNGTSVDQTTASTTNGWSAYLHVLSGTDLVVKVQDSADNSSWADLTDALFSEFDARGAQRIAGADNATVRRYVRVSWTGTGTFHTFFNRR